MMTRNWKERKTSQQTIQRNNHAIILKGNNRFTKTILKNLRDAKMLKILGLAQKQITIYQMIDVFGTTHSNSYRKVRALTDSMMLIKTGFHQDSNNNNKHLWEYVRSFESIFVKYDCMKNKEGLCYVFPSIILILNRKNYYKIHRDIKDEVGEGVR